VVVAVAVAGPRVAFALALVRDETREHRNSCPQHLCYIC